MSISLAVSLLNIPFDRFPPVLSSPTCPTSRTSTTSTSFGGSGQNPLCLRSLEWNVWLLFQSDTKNRYSLQKPGPDHSGTNYSCPVDAQSSNGEKDTGRPLSGKTPMELATGRKNKRSSGPASMNPEQLTSTPTKQDHLNEEIQKLALKTHLDVQQREDIRRDLAERMYVPPDLRAGEKVFHWQEDPSKIQQGRTSGKWLKVEIIAVNGAMTVISTGATIFPAHVSTLRRPLNTVDLEELRDSRDRAGAPVLWLSCEGPIVVWELFSDNSYLSAILDKQGLQVAAPIDMRTKKAESFSPQLIQGFWHKIKKKNPKIVGMSPTVETKSFKKKEVVWQQYHLSLAVAEHQIHG